MVGMRGNIENVIRNGRKLDCFSRYDNVGTGLELRTLTTCKLYRKQPTMTIGQLFLCHSNFVYDSLDFVFCDFYL